MINEYNKMLMLVVSRNKIIFGVAGKEETAICLKKSGFLCWVVLLFPAAT